MDDMESRERWQYYVSSYSRTEPTEGVDRSRMKPVVMARNLPSDSASDEVLKPKRLAFDEGMVLAVSVENSRIYFDPGTSEYFIYHAPLSTEEGQKRSEAKQQIGREVRDQKFREKMVMNNRWMKDLSREQVQGDNEAFQKLLGDRPASEHPTSAQAAAAASLK
jgi:paired amphipathic helix protein Sin3a